jgi:hydroxymethylbilane synthase
MVQTALAIDRLQRSLPGSSFEVVPITSEGDSRKEEPLRVFGDKAVFVSALESALIEDRADLAIHSLKDVPLASDPALRLVAFLAREDPRDVVVSASGDQLLELRPHGRVGTSSARRVDQLRQVRPDLEFADIRGNVETRLRRLSEGEYDAVVLAVAGINRLGIDVQHLEYLPVDMCTPAPGQGIIAIQCRSEDRRAADWTEIGDPEAATAARIERQIAELVGASCLTSFGALAEVRGEDVTISGWLQAAEGRGRRAIRRGLVVDAPRLAEEMAAELVGNLGAGPISAHGEQVNAGDQNL